MMNGGINMQRPMMNGMNGGMNQMNNGMMGLHQQQSNHSFHGGNNGMMSMIEDDRQMNEPPSMEEINNMRNIPSVISPNGTTPVVMITNLNEDEIDCDKIFTLCGVFGDVQRVKISYHKRDTAFVQLANHRQAKHVVTSLNRMQLYGKMIHVNLSRMTRVKLPKDSPNSAMMFPDAKFLTKDYTNCKNHRYSRKGAGGIKYSPLSIGQPSHILHIANLPINSEAKDLQQFLSGPVDNGRYRHNADRIQSIELIGVNNKLGSCQAFAKCHSVDMACQILIDFHSREFMGREIKISFATRSHMPSDINKTHKTYSYSTSKKQGASINSISASIARERPNMSTDTMSSGSSNGGQAAHHGHHSMGSGHQNGGHQNGGHQNGGHQNGYEPRFDRAERMERDMDYGGRYGGRGGYAQNQQVNFPQRPIIHSGPSFPAPSPYVVHEPTNPNDKIYIRTHHHSGGRKYRYKLRINK
jgi:RNA recognition motif-containing protein